MRPTPLLLAPVLVGCAAARSVPTYAAPVPGAPPAGMVHLVPKPPVLTPTKARYEWQAVCDRTFTSSSNVNGFVTLSRGVPSSQLAGRLPTVTTFYLQVETVPHGDGTMSVKVTQGEENAQTRPLLSPGAKPVGGGGGYVSSGSDGYKEAPAASLVLPLPPPPSSSSPPAPTSPA